MPGTLFVVATPIGNLEDVTLRALRVMREVSLIAAEDTRRTARLLQHYSISTRTTSLHEHNERSKTPFLIARLAASYWALSYGGPSMALAKPLRGTAMAMSFCGGLIPATIICLPFRIFSTTSLLSSNLASQLNEMQPAYWS